MAEYKGVLKTRLSAGLQVTSGMSPGPIHTISHPEPEIAPIRKERKKPLPHYYHYYTIHVSSSWEFKRRLASLR